MRIKQFFTLIGVLLRDRQFLKQTMIVSTWINLILSSVLDLRIRVSYFKSKSLTHFICSNHCQFQSYFSKDFFLSQLFFISAMVVLPTKEYRWPSAYQFGYLLVVPPNSSNLVVLSTFKMSANLNGCCKKKSEILDRSFNRLRGVFRTHSANKWATVCICRSVDSTVQIQHPYGTGVARVYRRFLLKLSSFLLIRIRSLEGSKFQTLKQKIFLVWFLNEPLRRSILTTAGGNRLIKPVAWCLMRSA